MLVIDISINRIDLVESILIQRIHTGETGNNTYKIVNPKGFENQLIRHRYKDGALKLLQKALNIIINEEENGRKGE